MSDEQLGVVIVSWNVRELLARCLYSLFAELERERIMARVVVVDNAAASILFLLNSNANGSWRASSWSITPHSIIRRI